MIVLLTGVTGFIGSHVARALVRLGHEVHATFRPSSDHRRIADLGAGVILHKGFMDTVPVDPDVTIHLAWYTVPGQYLEAPENIECLDASRRLLARVRGRVICTGTCFEYDTRVGLLREDSPTLPTTLYAQCKDVLRKEVVERPNGVWLRLFYQYGPWEDPRRMIPSAIQAVLRGEVVRATAGEQQRDYLHVEDVAAAVCAVAESRLEGVVNVGSGAPTTVREIMTTIGEYGHRPDLIRLGEMEYYPGEPMLVTAEVGKLRSTGWAPTVSLGYGLRRTFDWWRERMPRQTAAL
jgi:nucleoside-diphosphate-sugar epimerase